MVQTFRKRKGKAFPSSTLTSTQPGKDPSRPADTCNHRVIALASWPHTRTGVEVYVEDSRVREENKENKRGHWCTLLGLGDGGGSSRGSHGARE
ncbi:hypothetical protein RUM43_011788 [Polyplax serrata]|uniref:Uncharacterized protein n=1 Tax=Polyplax serrata TaxID=468196 RepID=A0AAN8P1J8_POLSC